MASFVDAVPYSTRFAVLRTSAVERIGSVTIAILSAAGVAVVGNSTRTLLRAFIRFVAVTIHSYICWPVGRFLGRSSSA